MQKSYFLLLFIFIPFLQYGQESKTIKGQIVTDNLDSLPIHIINITQGTGTVSSDDGGFNIKVRLKDSLLFSSLQYKNKTIVISPTVYSSGYLKLNLESEINELDEVKLHKLSGNLATDISSIKTFDLGSLGLPISDKPNPTIIDRKIMSMSNAMDPVGLIYGAISGENKKLKLARENYKQERFVYKIMEILPEDFYRLELGLKENEILEFLYYCASDVNLKNLVRANDSLGLMEYLQSRIQDYRAFLDLD